MIFRPQPKPEKPIILKGKELEKLRLECYVRDKGCCQDCGKFVPANGSVFNRGHMAHIKRRNKGGDILSNVQWKCYDCHIGYEHGPRWSKK